MITFLFYVLVAALAFLVISKKADEARLAGVAHFKGAPKGLIPIAAAIGALFWPIFMVAGLVRSLSKKPK
ncbi:hypothetical protein PXH69_24560 [Rhodococcus qingshengii]|uniref:Uncharacterized protein n=1 Tax=Rhodococcus qingshengii TaxID=334542 RepID=A0AAW6LNK2_RHOSG|nr:hypothetical protein [Rhodococcus qingshengii]MDE8648144.1 hypothetical protein [Rhodococcus qingshengii]